MENRNMEDRHTETEIRKDYAASGLFIELAVSRTTHFSSTPIEWIITVYHVSVFYHCTDRKSVG